MGDFNSIPSLHQMYYGAHQVHGQNNSLQSTDSNLNTRCCSMCGFQHSLNDNHYRNELNQCGKEQTGGKKGDDSSGKGCSSGCGDKGSKGKGESQGRQDKGNSGNGGGDRGAGDADRRSASDSSKPKDAAPAAAPGGKIMIVDDPNVIPDWLKDYYFYGFCFIIFICLVSVLACRRSENIWDCLKVTSLMGGLSSCDLNEGVNKFFEKNGVGAKNQSGNGKDKSNEANGPAPAHLEDKVKQVRKALRNANCQKYGSDEKCSGLVDYAGTMAGGAIVSTGNTDVVRNQMLCRCMDPKLYKHVCFPGEGKCSDCSCDTIPMDTLITEEDKLIPGKCWAFRGVGEVQIKLFYPLIVLGTTIHHPSKSRLPPGYFSSAPKDFELWGLGGNNTAPYHFGTFQFKEDGGSTQIFEVQNPSNTFYPQVKFNFTSNHGNRNYSTLYKVELHGVIDN